MRPEEARAAGKALGARDVEVLDYGDSKLIHADPVAAKAALLALILAHRPSTIISFDERVGYYGHPDHAQAGRWAAEIVRAGQGQPGFPVTRLYQATLPAPAIALSRRYISAFRTHYPTDPAKGLPAPTIAVPIASEASAKRAVLDAHKTQVKVIDDVQPGGRRVPAWLYYRLFDREYFALAECLRRIEMSRGAPDRNVTAGVRGRVAGGRVASTSRRARPPPDARAGQLRLCFPSAR